MTALAAKGQPKTDQAETEQKNQARLSNAFDAAAARARCKRHRKRILEMTQSVSALHVGGAFSATEIVDCIYYGLMRPGAHGGVVGKDAPDTFLMSKGHGYMIQAVILEDIGVLKRSDLAAYCTPTGKLGVHPDYGIPGIEASTGSLGHGLSLALGMAYAELSRGRIGNVYTVLSDGEVQEGSTWEATLMASSLKVRNLVAFIDNNDMQSLGFTHVTHPSFYPVVDKFLAFGWDCVEVNGHDSLAIYDAVISRKGDRPLMVNCKTTKGRGVSYMENVPMWHYRSPNKAEYEQAIREIDEAAE
jgi:transketolase